MDKLDWTKNKYSSSSKKQLAAITNTLPQLNTELSAKLSNNSRIDTHPGQSFKGNSSMDMKSVDGRTTNPNALTSSPSQEFNTGFKQNRSYTKYSINDFYLTGLVKLKQHTLASSKQPKIKDQSSLELSIPKKTIDQRITETLTKIRKESRIENKFFNRLEGATKEYFLEKKQFHKVFTNFDSAFELQQHVLNGVKCYKPELGTMLESSMGTLLDCCIGLCRLVKKEVMQIEEETELRLKDTSNNYYKLEKQRAGLEVSLRNYQMLVKAKEVEFEVAQGQIQSLREENKYLTEWIRKQTEFTIQAATQGRIMITRPG